MAAIEESGIPHRRLNPLSGDWVFVSPQRNSRPWQGQTEASGEPAGLPYDRECYLCPGNERANGAANPSYTGVYVFTNDFPALVDVGRSRPAGLQDPLMAAQSVSGTCRVICYSPRHDLSLGDLSLDDLCAVIDAWGDQYEDLSSRYSWVQVFENRGSLMGCSNPHPHGQIWAASYVPELVQRENARQLDYYTRNGRQMLLDYAERELATKKRLVFVNDSWIVVVPYWASWPFETLLLPRRAVATLQDLGRKERLSLGEALRTLLRTYDRLFLTPFPYSMGWHPAPPHTGSEHWQLHAHFNPPLLRSATVRKFMVGFEMFAEAQRDLTPEKAAETLRMARDCVPAEKD